MIYLDHHATTPLSARARDAMSAAMLVAHGNASSVHAAGRRARALLEDARAALAAVVGAAPRELVWTSGGTEAVHLAVRGVGAALAPRVVLCDGGGHPALRAACDALAQRAGCAVERLPAAAGGAPDLAATVTRAAAAGGPALVALSLVQHETGAIAPVRALADALRAVGGVVVVDAVQALGKLPLDLGTLGAAAAAVSAHKIGGPSGVGAAWIAAGVRAHGLVTGGAQERGLRAGTENVLGAVGFGAAARAVPERLAAMPRVGALRDQIEAALRAIDGVVINGAERARVATACHASVRGAAGEELVAAFDLEGFCVSSGPACASGRPEPSSSMLALYRDEPWRAVSALRVTLGPETTEADAARFAAAVAHVVARVRLA